MNGFVGTIALAGVLAIGSPAAAAGALPLPAWPSVSCATGELTLTPPPTPTGPIHVFAWIRPCPDVRASRFAQFTIVYYRQADALPGVLQPYGPAGASDVEGILNPGMLGSTQAVCLAYSPSGRLSCYSVRVDVMGVVLDTTRISIDDPRVRVPVSTPSLIGGPEPNPTCATCL